LSADARGPILLLFDIDGTLLRRAATEHAEALRQALREVHGVDIAGTRPGISPAGRTDGEIARLLLTLLGIPAKQIDERATDVRIACCEAFAQLGPADLSDKVLPGMAALLDQLEERDDVVTSLVTGNYEAVARLKLRAAGIGDHFRPGQGGFGSDAEDRTLLPPIARRRAGEDGVPFPRERTIVIGDTPRDIACARADEVRVVAVATGPCDASELQDADAVARDGRELATVLGAWLPA